MCLKEAHQADSTSSVCFVASWDTIGSGKPDETRDAD
jgi:hypothetical protein